jgi:uncharacterized protein DUF1634
MRRRCECGGVRRCGRRGLSLEACNSADRPYRVPRGASGLAIGSRDFRQRVVWKRGERLIQLGLLVLIGTPIVRVLSSVVGMARERDQVYLGITLIVLGLLAFSLFAA